MSAREDRALAELVSEMTAEGLVHREDTTLIFGSGDDKFMIELKVLDVTEGDSDDSRVGIDAQTPSASAGVDRGVPAEDRGRPYPYFRVAHLPVRKARVRHPGAR